MSQRYQWRMPSRNLGLLNAELIAAGGSALQVNDAVALGIALMASAYAAIRELKAARDQGMDALL